MKISQLFSFMKNSYQYNNCFSNKIMNASRTVEILQLISFPSWHFINIIKDVFNLRFFSIS